ncbi:hypothetical protein [Amycolatopsis sp. NPDC051128]|uniref:hypothetical protein n=1 Tax=Amycolatopsis sp. NPDC051128 TaxID=3155412 RepID=UPI00342C3362
MASTDPGTGRLAVPVENTACALRRLAPGAALREPRTPELRVLARALLGCSPMELARRHPGPVARVVLGDQLRALDQAMTGLFRPDTPGPEAARLVRAARYSGAWRAGRRAGALLDRLRTEPGLRAAALGWANGTGHRILADELRGAPVVPDGEDGVRAAELTVAALLPPADFGDPGREVLVSRVDAGECEPSGPLPGDRGPEGLSSRAAFLDVRSVRVGDHGFRVDIDSDPPVDLVDDRGGPTLRALWWTGLGRVADDLGHEYLLLAKDPARTGLVRHWCHPRPASGARMLRLESAGYRGERLRLDPAAAGTSAEVLVKFELTVRLGG